MIFKRKIIITSIAVAVLFASCARIFNATPSAKDSNPTTPHSIAPDPASTLADAPGWERSNAAFYQIWVASFSDSDGDGTGDLQGIMNKIDAGYFNKLGVNALWLSPIFKAASLSSTSGNKHGYDTIDYSSVSPLFGDKDTLKQLLIHAHQHGLRVLFDYVPNHTSSANPWFSDPTKRDWYVRRATKPSGWGGFDAYSDWYYSGSGGSTPYYYAVFGSTMPDLNYWDSDVETAMENVAVDWLNFGFDGMRVDAVKYLYEGSSDSQWKDQPQTLAWFQRLRSEVVDAYPTSAKCMIAENWDSNMSNVESYLESGGKKGFNMSLDFIWPYTLTSNLSGDGSTSEVSALLHHLVDDNNALPSGSSFGVFESNHDNVVSRPATAFAGDAGRIYLAAALSILGKGAPIIYYGNEIGMTGAAGYDGDLRRPFNWNAEAGEEADPDSLWSWNADLLWLRSTYAAWDDPAISTVVSSDSRVLSFLITGISGKRALVIANTSSSSITASIEFSLPSTPASATALIGVGSGVLLGAARLDLASLPAFAFRVFALDDPTAVPIRATDVNYSGYAPVAPALSQLYLRGSFNSWGTNLPLVSQGGGVSFASVNLAAGTTYDFKFGSGESSNWGTALGWIDIVYDATRSGALPSNVVSDTGAPYYNIAFTAPQDGSYQFVIDTAATPYGYWIVPNI